MKKSLAIFMVFCAAQVFAQDYHFTQTNQFLLLQNPANTGLFDGWERAGIGHKTQWANAGSKFQTSVISADLNLFRKRTGEGASLGLGLLFLTDKVGDSKYGTKQMAFSISGIVPLAENHKIAMGIQAGLGQKSGDFSQLIFSSQFNGSELDENLNSGESNNLASFIYPDISAGGLYQFGSDQSNLGSSGQPKIVAGIAYYHLNRPTLRFRLGGTEKLYAKWVFHGSFTKVFKGSDQGVELVLNQTIQGPHTETNIGALLRHYLSKGSKITGFKQPAYLGFGMFYRHKDAIAPMVQINYKGFDFGLSYDITLSTLGQVSRGGGIEFSLVYTNFDYALFKRQRY